jgi:hypothetical protein
MGPNHDFGVYNNSVHSVQCALEERYFLCKVNGQYLPAIETQARSWEVDTLVMFRRSVVQEVCAVATTISLLDVVNCYRGAKRRIYWNAFVSLLRVPLNRKDAELRPFTKFEKQSLFKAPRIINPRSPRYNLVLGKYLKKAEKLYYKAINLAWGDRTAHTVIKGLNVFESAAVMRAKWDCFHEPVAVGLDASKFDMHVSVEALRFEHSFYNLVFDSAELAWLLELQVHNKGRAYCPDGTVDFTMPGTRASGDLNTSLGNCVLMCALIWAMCKQLGVVAELANNGDDCVLIMESGDLERTLAAVPGYFARYGFRMVVEEPVYVFEEIEFCQAHPVWLGDAWAMVRNVRTCLQKDPMCLVPIQNNKVWRKWLWAVGVCGQAVVPGCPVLQSFYRAFERSGVKSTARFRERVFRHTSMMERMEGLSGEGRAVTAESRSSFYRATGVMPDYQIALERYFDAFEIGCIDKNMKVMDGLVEVCPPPFLRHL